MSPRSVKPRVGSPRGCPSDISALPASAWPPDLLLKAGDSASSHTISVSPLNCAGSDGEPFLVPLGVEGRLSAVADLMAQSLATQIAERPQSNEIGPMRALLHLADFGIVLLDAAGAVIFVNEHAQGMFAAGTILAPRRDRLQCAVTASRQSFEQALYAQCEAARRRCPTPASILRVPHPRGPGAALLKIQQFGWAERAEVGPWVVVFIFDTQRKRNHHLHTLRELYGLSQHEAKVAFLLADGCDIPEIAKRMHIAKNTVRAHLRSAYAKTGTKKQAQLVARVCRDLLALESLLR